MALRDGLSRRALLRGAAGAALALPFLESWAWRTAAAKEPTLPLRLLFVYVPNGVHLPAWRPAADGAGHELPPTLEPLTPYRSKLLVLSGLTLDGARPHGDGPGDHARAGASFLTCAHPRKTGGADIAAGVSVDQLAAKVLGQGTPFPSLELGTEPSAQGGSCDSGYSCAYSSNLAWSGPATPLAKEISPRRAFERLFLDGQGLSVQERARRRRFRASVLDAVTGDARSIRGRLGAQDQRKLDEYLESVRELERRLAPTAREKSVAPLGPEPPAGIPQDHGEHLRRMHDVIHLAFQTDTTRVVTLMCGNEGSNRAYREVGVREGHHDLSHHGKDPAKQEKVAKIDRFHVEQLAYLVKKLDSVREGQGTLLDRTLIVYGSAIADGDAHDHGDLPILLLGGGRTGLATGGIRTFPRETPLADLYLWLLGKAGARVESFADSRGPLPLDR